MKHSQPAVIFVTLTVVAIAAFFIISNAPGKYDDFARCINTSGAKMYGAFWCTHCNDQKDMFGSSWKYAPYVECSTPDGQGMLPVCREAGIKGYPTWKFADGTNKSGLLSFEELSQKTGCPLPE